MSRTTDHTSMPYVDSIKIFGYYYDFAAVQNRLAQFGGISLTADWLNTDITALFQPSPNACSSFDQQQYNCVIPNTKFPRSPPLGPQPGQPCPDFKWIATLAPQAIAFFSWEDLASIQTVKSSPHTLLLYNNAILNLTSGINTTPILQDSSIMSLAASSIGKDGTLAFSSSDSAIRAIRCLRQKYIVGYMVSESIGCAITHAIQSFCLMIIGGVIVIKVLMAVVFNLSNGFGGKKGSRRNRKSADTQDLEDGQQPSHYDLDGSTTITEDEDPHVILFVTCYSEGLESIKSTVESLASTEYPETKKLLFVVADGLVTGSGNLQSTPDAILSLMTFAEQPQSQVPQSYLAIAEGSKQHNMAKVYAGYYLNNKNAAVPMICVIKCGTPTESLETGQKKAGNRGKRDSQLVLMNFLSRVLFNDRMTALDFDLYTKISAIAAPPSAFQLVLMVDADTVVDSKSLNHMVAVMQKDDHVMGLCGETQIANKFKSWVTAIQVFEYFLSHHLGKSFESSFGGVTCLPGCFCMYRIKMPKGPCGAWTVPVLANPDIVEEYSENMVDTLHQKNLLLLGEDRFLTTLMVFCALASTAF
ncbi:UNVERIFIED_CONTAM: hypothetical protein HDU68_007350 [Siphonaria sp. JEL0065]|nr:hypothetical protein HDU68_007350 [Siphonaria sp. JEL0065]